MLRLAGVSKSFGGVRALDRVDFELSPGEVHCLAGENGSGKSTLIKVISGVHAPEPGAVIEFDGRRVAKLDPVAARAHGVQVIWQDLALFPHMSVAENVAFERSLGSTPRWFSRKEAREVAAAAAGRLGAALDLDRPVKDLPIAQRQVVAICRALAADARLVFMDEPTASLTGAETEALLKVVRKLSSDGIAVVFVSHRLAEVTAVAERVTVLRDGKLVGVFPARGLTQARLTELMTGREVAQAVRARDLSDAPVVLETRGLTRAGEFEDVSIELRQGEVLGLTGLLGAGRTELATTLFGMRRPDAGEILLNGQRLRLSSNRDAIDAGIAYVPEDRLSLGLVQPQSISDNTAITVTNKVTRAGLMREGAKRSLVQGWLERLRVKLGSPDDAVATLSGGNQQRVVLAKWLATEPSVLILDSPTVGVDVGAREGLFAIARGLAASGVAILLISDEITEVYHNADRVLVMQSGRIVDSFTPGVDSMVAIERAVHG